MSDAATLGIAANLNLNMGTLLVAVVVSAVLLGLSLWQTVFYYSNYSKDGLPLKTLVAVTVLLDTLHLCFISHTVYHYLITYRGNIEAINRMVWSILAEVQVTTILAALVQSFYVSRLWTLSRKNVVLTGIVVVMVLGNIGFVVLSFRLVTFADLEKIASVTMSIDVLSAATDIYIAATLCYLLARSRTGFKKSDDMIKTLMLFVVNTGVLTSVCAVATVICLIASPYSLVFAAFYFCIGRLYTNSFLASLNARRTISGKASKQDTSHLLISIPTNVLGASGEGGHTGTSAAQNPAADNFKENRNSTLVPFKRRTRCGSTFKVNVNVSVETMRGTTEATATNRDYDDADLDSEFGQGRESLRGGGGNVEV